ncbi:hypothetical protein DW322_03425 [Rhodococcus rhodnii]|uniref:Uncharacterized protein n=2 Tax=Rhodococcus rhodnii TaxID=38312 RepID=R7WKS6_9NOCA|nr:hypothetical protein [Rhodococcus rhodnii]EOM74619.1 hypothetical protein Rrhod_4094 [Rhodococcus rhodnii LMG 5362]TXG89453.1 hypothetical protein DW322_03425 [Rhodococcus rhodnii]
MTANVIELHRGYEEFWQARPALSHIREFARARRAGLWAVLDCTLARAIAALEPPVMLPASIGSAASCNLFVALVGPSGGGKGVAEGASRDAVRFVDHTGHDIETDEFPLGSGEGLVKTFLPAPGEDETSRRTRAIVSAPEVDSLAALGSRQGSTLMPELRKLNMGEQAGFNNASRATRSVLPAHSYRLCLILGVQPQKARPLLHDADGGTPQRFVYAPVGDPDAPDEPPATPDPLVVKMPKWPTTAVHLQIPEIARREMDRHRLATLRGEDVDPLDGHRMLTRLKVAVGLMLLDGRSVCSEEDWHLSGVVMRVSDRTRAGIERTLTESARAVNRARAQADGERAAIVEDHKHAAEIERVRGAILRRLKKHGRVPLRDISKGTKFEIRPHVQPVLDDLAEEGVVRMIQDGDRQLFELSDEQP